jgi:tripeptidyl-peptidase-1
LLFPSGSGVGMDKACLSNDGQNIRKFIPFFPASCPYVTAVGSTQKYNPEVVALNFNPFSASGGGFSEYFPQPSYQASTVNAYISSLENGLNGLYNSSGRAYPDVAAQGQNIVIHYRGDDLATDGTSASTSIMAGVVALLNDYRVANN